MKKMISVIVPVYNASEYLDTTINSILIQEEVGEVILIDDCSTDDSLKIIMSWKKKDDRIKFFKTEENSGSGKARNIGIKNTSFPYLSFLDADDYFGTNRFKKSIEILESHKEIDGVYSDVVNIQLDNFRKASWSHNNKIGTPYKIKPDILFEYIINEKGDFFSIISLVLRKTAISKSGYFDENLLIGQDIDFIYSLAQNCKLIDSEEKEINVFRRLHGSNITSSEKYLEYNPRFRIVRKWVNKCKSENYNLQTKRAFYIRYVHHVYKNEGYNYPKPLKWVKKILILIEVIFKKFV